MCEFDGVQTKQVRTSPFLFSSMLFKKPIPHGARHLIGNKDRKKVRSSILTWFPYCTEEAFDEVLMPKHEEITVLKVQASKINIYFSKSEPIFFSVDGELFPTFYALCRLPTLVPCYLIHDGASKFILSGADLMVPGIIKPNDLGCYGESGLLHNKRMGIRVYGNPLPFAVGRCSITNNCFLQGKGKALEVLHVFGDSLWSLGSKLVPNAGFTPKFISRIDPLISESSQWYPPQNVSEGYPVETNTSFVSNVSGTTFANEEEEEEDDDDGWGVGHLEEKDNLPISPAISDGTTHSVSIISPKPSIVNTSAETLVEPDLIEPPLCELSNIEQLNASNADAKTQPICEPLKVKEVTQPKIIDYFLELLLLEILHVDVPDSSCPLNVSGVFSKMSQASSYQQFHSLFTQRINSELNSNISSQISNGTMSVPCDLKRSTHKKLAKFFQYYTKQQLIQTKEIRNELMLLSVNRRSPLYISYTPLTDKERKYAKNRLLLARPQNNKLLDNSTSQTNSTLETSHTVNHASSLPNATLSNSNDFQVLDLYLPTSSSQPIFEASPDILPAVAERYYFAPQCREILARYLKQYCGTPASSSSQVIVNEHLKQCVLTKKERLTVKLNYKQGPYSEEICVMEKSELFQRFISGLTFFHVICRVGEDPSAISPLKIRRNKLQPITIRLEKRQKSKAVTTISHIQEFEIDEKYLAEILQRALASSASTFQLTGAAKGKDKPLGVLVQGSFVDAVSDILVSQFGVPKRFIMTM